MPPITFWPNNSKSLLLAANIIFIVKGLKNQTVKEE